MDFPRAQNGHKMTLKSTLCGTLPEGMVYQGFRSALSQVPPEHICLCNCVGHKKHLHTVSIFPGTGAYKQDLAIVAK